MPAGAFPQKQSTGNFPSLFSYWVKVDIDRHVRGWEKPSDHVPVVADLALEPR